MVHKRERRPTTATSFLLPSEITHTGKTYEDYYSRLDPPPVSDKPRKPASVPVEVVVPVRYDWQKKKRNRYYLTAEWRALRAQVLERDNGICQYCGDPGIQADHIRPRRKKGPDTLDNLVCACTACNRVAGAKVFRSFEKKKAWILKVRKR